MIRIVLFTICLSLYPALIKAQAMDSCLTIKVEPVKKIVNNPNKFDTVKTISFRCHAGPSITSKQQPLIVVDGKVKPYSFLNSIDPDQIEKVNIVKDPKGNKKLIRHNPQAKNGVIYVILKKCEADTKATLTRLIL